MNDAFYDIERAVDYAFSQNKFVMDIYAYMKVKNFRRIDAQTILRSSTVKHLQTTIQDLDTYLQGGQTDAAVYVRQAYGFLSKPDARKIRNYLDNIIEDIKRFIKDKNAKKKPRKITK